MQLPLVTDLIVVGVCFASILIALAKSFRSVHNSTSRKVAIIVMLFIVGIIYVGDFFGWYTDQTILGWVATAQVASSVMCLIAVSALP